MQRLTFIAVYIRSQSDKVGTEILVIRALSPLPTVTVKDQDDDTVSLLIENINPDIYENILTKSGKNFILNVITCGS